MSRICYLVALTQSDTFDKVTEYRHTQLCTGGALMFLNVVICLLTCGSSQSLGGNVSALPPEIRTPPPSKVTTVTSDSVIPISP